MMFRKKLSLIKVATFLLALAPLVAGSQRSLWIFIGEPTLPAKLPTQF